MNDLNARLQDAHKVDDKHALVTLYSEAAKASADPDTRAFFLTHAYIFALEIDHPNTAALHSQLVVMKRET